VCASSVPVGSAILKYELDIGRRKQDICAPSSLAGEGCATGVASTKSVASTTITKVSDFMVWVETKGLTQ
jgi:hypothetical protein